MMNTATEQAKVKRYSCKCILCKAKWTTTETDRTKAYDAHESKCSRYAEVFARRRASRYSMSDEGERYQMSALYFQHRQIEGRHNPAIVCDGRCMGATGHSCECSCGGANHGANKAA